VDKVKTTVPEAETKTNIRIIMGKINYKIVIVTDICMRKGKDKTKLCMFTPLRRMKERRYCSSHS
jgi:hypothetical protein